MSSVGRGRESFVRESRSLKGEVSNNSSAGHFSR